MSALCTVLNSEKRTLGGEEACLDYTWQNSSNRGAKRSERDVSPTISSLFRKIYSTQFKIAIHKSTFHYYFFFNSANLFVKASKASSSFFPCPPPAVVEVEGGGLGPVNPGLGKLVRTTTVSFALLGSTGGV